MTLIDNSSSDKCHHDLLLTLPFAPAMGSAVDPLVDEITWTGWRMAGASPRAITSEDAARSATGVLDLLVETLWDPGRVVVITELSAYTSASPNGLLCCLMFGLLGSKGETAASAIAARQVVTALVARPGFPYALEPVDPSEVLESPTAEMAHTALVRQQMVAVDVADEQVELLSRFNPVMDSWSPIGRLLIERAVPMRVRATVLATELSIDDRMSLRRSLDHVQRLSVCEPSNADARFSLERATSTLVDIKASFSSPLLAVEVAVTSAFALPDPTLRAIGSAFTSKTDVLRQLGHVVVAGQRRLLGGFELQRDPPGLTEALQSGIPLHGGMGSRGLRDVVTLTESPIGWPVPAGGPIPTIPTMITRTRPIPPELTEGLFVGFGQGGNDVRIPPAEAARHALITGETGSGKSTFLVATALARLRQGQPFIFIDPHGQAVGDHIAAHAEAEGIPLAVLDATDGASEALSPFPALRRDQRNLPEVTLAVGHFADAITSSLRDGDWSGPRWRQHFMAIGYLAASHRVHLAEAVAWYADTRGRMDLLAHPALPESARRTLLLLNAAKSDEAATLIDWVVCKVDPLATGPAKRLLAAPGKGIDLGKLVAEGRSLVVNLAGLGLADGALVGHLILSGVLDAAISQTDLPHSYFVFVDEAPRFPAKNIERVIAEGRKFHVSLFLAAQHLSQFPNDSLRDTVTAASVKLAFRQTPEGAGAHQLAHMFDVLPPELSDQPDLHALLRVGRYPVTSVQVPHYEDAPQRIKQPITATAVRRKPAKVRALKKEVQAEVHNSADWIDEFLQSRGARVTHA
jgi:hypothetical protein